MASLQVREYSHHAHIIPYYTARVSNNQFGKLGNWEMGNGCHREATPFSAAVREARTLRTSLRDNHYSQRHKL